MKSLFLPLGLSLAFLIALLFPEPGKYAGALNPLGLKSASWMVAFVFLVSGYRLKIGELFASSGLIKTTLVGAVINQFLAFLLVLPVGYALSSLPMGNAVAVSIGVTMMLCSSTTLSSGFVIAGANGGNLAWAMAMTVSLTLIGILVMPFTLAFALSAASSVQLPVGSMLVKILSIVLIPMSLGQILARIAGVKKFILLPYLSSLGIIAIVWMTVSTYHEKIIRLGWLECLLIPSSGLAVHLLLLLACFFSARMLRLPYPEKTSLVFVASQKSLPVAISAFAATQESLPIEARGLAVISFALIHFAQILGDSFLGGWFYSRHKTANPEHGG